MNINANDNFWFIPLFPLLAAIITAFFGKRMKSKAHIPAVLGIGLSALYAILSLFLTSAGKANYTDNYEWLHAGIFRVDLQLLNDPLAALMLVTITCVSFLVVIFSVGYMHNDEGYARYFAVFSLFVFCMTMLVLSANFVLTFLFWEGVGLCSYLLIGHWFQKPSAARAARKAFIVNRVGDFGFLIAVAMMWVTFGSTDYAYIFSDEHIHSASSKSIQWICFFLVLAAIGKSAQFPLHVWLPDAMEGPTPVSALIHAATMVTAGVYLIARSTPLMVHAAGIQLLIAILGCITALMAAIIAVTQTDLKRVLAYSTCSQLGFMFMALGSAAGNPKIIAFAVTAAIFHLFTHAFFKALLFLGAGSVMHAMGDVIDMRQFSGLRKKLPWTYITFAIGTASLSGIITFGGFWSKDQILAMLKYASGVAVPAHAEEAAGVHYPLTFTFMLLIAFVTSAVTAFYSFRAFFKTFWGEEKIPEAVQGHVHEGGLYSLMPLWALAGASYVLPLIVGPMTDYFADFLVSTPGFPKVDSDPSHSPLHAGNLLLLLSTIVPLLGAGLAYLMYARPSDSAEKVAKRRRTLFALSQGKFYVDEIYSAWIVKPLESLARGIKWFDVNIVDGLVDLAAKMVRGIGSFFMPIQNGLVQFYALAMLLGIVVFIVAMVARLHAG